MHFCTPSQGTFTTFSATSPDIEQCLLFSWSKFCWFLLAMKFPHPLLALAGCSLLHMYAAAMLNGCSPCKYEVDACLSYRPLARCRRFGHFHLTKKKLCWHDICNYHLFSPDSLASRSFLHFESRYDCSRQIEDQGWSFLTVGLMPDCWYVHS